ncbi:MAG: phosphotransferase family protein [Thermoplasmataceae archaeon]
MNYPQPSRVGEIINSVFPGIRATNCKQLDGGWDSHVFDVDGSYIFKFPKNDLAEKSLKKEISLLSELKKFLSVSLPSHEYVHNEHTPQPFVGYRKLAGTTIEEYKLDGNSEIVLSKMMSRFYSEMRLFPLEIATEKGVPLLDGKKWKTRYEDIFDRFRLHTFPVLGKNELKTVQNKFNDYFREPMNFEFEPKLVHGDLCVDHVLFNFGVSEILGIIDWGDTMIGDPAVDFAWLHGILPENLTLRTIIDAGYREPAGILKRSRFFYEISPLFAISYYSAEGDKKKMKIALKRLSDIIG